MKTIIIDGVEYTLTPTKQEKELFIGELNGKRYYLGPEANEAMTWLDAIYWCTLLGEEYTLPSRIVLLMCYENDTLHDRFMADCYYWSSAEYDSSLAWFQTFLDGSQFSTNKTTAAHVRAVRVEPIN